MKKGGAELPIIVENDNFEKTMKELLGLARAHDLSSYDASYLELAMRKGLPLATLDDKLRKAAAHASVPILFIRLP